jgi:hypothetical protein
MSATAATISDMSWDHTNLPSLRSLDKAAVARFINDNTTYSPVPLKPRDIGEFTWADLAGDGRYELVTTIDVNGRAFFDALVVFWRNISGTVTYQEIRDRGIDNLDTVIKDLTGDGRDELVIPTVLIEYSTADTFTWPAIYKLQGEHYVDASKDFATYYEKEVLPDLNAKIDDPNAQTFGTLSSEETRAVLTMERAKILRVIGRDPKAGLKQAYQWMNSEDPRLLQDAAATFQEIGGHPSELRTAREAYDRAVARERAAAH